MSPRRSYVTTLVAAGLLGVAPAASAVPQAVEFQLGADKILDLLGDRAKLIDPGCPEIFDAGLSGLHEAIVDHVVFGDPELLREDDATSMSFQTGNINVFRPRARLPVEVHIKSVDCVNDPNCALDDTLPVQVFLSFALTADTDEICATFTHSEALLVPQEALDQVDGIVAQFGPMCAPLSLGAVTGLLGDGATVADVALSANTALDRLAIRLDMDTPDGAAGSTLSNWQTFMNGTIADAGTEDFSVLVDAAMLRHSFERQLTDGITCDPSDPSSDGCNDEIEPREDATSAWLPWVPEVDVAVETGVEVWGCWDITTDVTLDSALSLSSTGDAIDVAADLDWDPSDGELFACSLVNPLFAFTLPVPAFFGIMEGIAANYSAAAKIDDALPSECDLVDDHNIDCSFPFDLPKIDLGPGPDGILSATNLRGTSAGLVLEGDVDILGFANAPEPLELSGTAPVYGVHGDCSDLGIGYLGWLDVGGGTGDYCHAPDSGAASPFVVDDTWDAYNLYDIDEGPADEVSIGLGGDWIDLFWDDPYGMTATVWTTVGSGSITLDKPIEHVGIDWGIIGDYIMAYVNCHFREQTGLFGIPGKFDFHWLVDPPPYELVAIGSEFDRAVATLDKASFTQVGETYVDEKSGLTVMPSKSVMLSTSWTVDGGRAGKFSFSAETPMTMDLGGTKLFDGYAFAVGAPTTVTVAVPREALPRGAKEASVSVELDPATVATGYTLR